MPFSGPSSGGKSGFSGPKKKKKKSHGGGGIFGSLVHHLIHNPATKYGGRTARDLGNVARHAPGAIIGTGAALSQDVFDAAIHPHRSPLRRTRRIFGGIPRQLQEDFRHPLRHPGYTLLDALSFIPPVAAAGRVARAGTLARATKTPTRILHHKSRTMEEENALSDARGLPKHGRKIGRVHEVPVPLSLSPTAAGAQKLGDLLRQKRGKTFGKTHREIQRETDIIQRLAHGAEPGFVASVKEVKGRRKRRKAGEKIPKIRHQPIREFNSLIRALRLYRPGYLLPNVLGGLTANVTQGALTPAVIRQAARLRGTSEAEAVRSLLGGGISRHGGSGLLHNQAPSEVGPIQALAGGVGESAGKITDRGPRLMAFLREAHRQGHITDRQVKNLIKDPKLRRDLVQVVRRAEPEAIKFSRTRSRTGKLAKLDRIGAENIFLYKWITGSTAYAGHTVAHHPLKTGAVAATGRNTPDVSDVLKKYPDWMGQYIPLAGKTKEGFPRLSGAQAYSLWSSPGEIADTIKAGVKDPRQLVAPLNPAQHMAAVAILGYDPFKRYELKDKSAKKNLLFALNAELSGSPYMNYLPFNALPYRKTKSGKPVYTFEKGRFYDTEAQRLRRLLPRSKGDILAQFFAGSVWPGPSNPKVAAEMPGAKRHVKKKKRKRR